MKPAKKSEENSDPKEELNGMTKAHQKLDVTDERRP